jgi:hypothetical protein
VGSFRQSKVSWIDIYLQKVIEGLDGFLKSKLMGKKRLNVTYQQEKTVFSRLTWKKNENEIMIWKKCLKKLLFLQPFFLTVQCRYDVMACLKVAQHIPESRIDSILSIYFFWPDFSLREN